MEVRLFDRCRCKGFYKKAHYGLFIYLDRENLRADLVNSNLACATDDGTVEKGIECVEKRYYEHKDGNFSGVIVGFVDLVVVGYLDVIYQDACDVGVGIIPEKYYIAKRPKETVKCTVVYYANNLKHFVPIEDIVEVLSGVRN